MLFLLFGSTINIPQLKIDFGQSKDGQNWNVINDGVMGGLSQGQAQLSENGLLFKGKVSLANNGGFASFKGPFEPTDLSDFETVKIRLRSTGCQFAMTLEMYERFYYPYFKHPLQTSGSGEWEILELKLSDFKAYQMGRLVGTKLTDKEKKEIIRLGVITNEKREIPFELEIDYISFE
ncbi:MAG: CIA30 family protein [Bacteroidota bacterium]